MSMRRRRQRRNRRIAAAVLVLLALGLVVLLVVGLGRWLKQETVAPVSSSEVVEAAPPSSVPPATEVSSSTPEPESEAVPTPPPVTGDLDVEMPPLYNRYHEIPQENHGDNITLAQTINGYLMEPQTAEAYTAMYNAAAEEGVWLTPVSAYRSRERQTGNFNSALANNTAAYGEEEGRRQTERYYAIPGTSEHEAGLAMDIGVVDDSFFDTPAYDWLQEHAHEYGFIFRYPGGQRSDGKSYEADLTYIAWEPWHYRFVGVNHATEIRRLSALLPGEEDVLTLEEYLAYLAGEEVAVLE